MAAIDTPSQTYYSLQDQTDDTKSGVKTRCEGCEMDIVGGGYYSNDNGTYGFCYLCIEKENSAQGFRVIRLCARCNGLCGAPAIQHVEGCRLSNYSDTEEGGQYHCAPCCVSTGCTCPQQPETFGPSFYRKCKQLPGSINGELVPGRFNIIEPCSEYGDYPGHRNWEALHRVAINRSPCNSGDWQDSLTIMEGIALTILAQLEGSSVAWRAVRESTRSHTVMEVMLNIPTYKLNGFGSGLVLGLDAFIRRTDYIGFDHIFSCYGSRMRNKWQPTKEGMLNVQRNLHKLLHKLASSQPGTVSWEDVFLISHDTDDMRPLGCQTCYAGCDRCQLTPLWHHNSGALLPHFAGMGTRNKPGEMTMEQEENRMAEAQEIKDALVAMIIEANEFGNENLHTSRAISAIKRKGTIFYEDISTYVSDVIVTPIVDKVPQYMFDGAVQKISHMVGRNDYGEGHIWIMPPTCTVSIEEVYIRTVGRAIFAILYAPAGTVNMQRLVEQFAPRWTPHLEVHQNEVTECQERGKGAIRGRIEGPIPGRITWLDLTEIDAAEMIREESGQGEELRGCGGHVFDISHNALSFVDMVQTSVEPSSKQQIRYRYIGIGIDMVRTPVEPINQTRRDILSVGCRDLLRDFRAGLNTEHHNFHIMCALGYIQGEGEKKHGGKRTPFCGLTVVVVVVVDILFQTKKNTLVIGHCTA